MTKVKQLYEDSILYEKPLLAHYILFLLQEGKVSLDDDASVIDFKDAGHEKVLKMVSENHLGFSQIKVFTLRYDDSKFAFVFAKNKAEATEYFKKITRKQSDFCVETSLDELVTNGKRNVTFRELRRDFNSFPALAGVFEGDWWNGTSSTG